MKIVKTFLISLVILISTLLIGFSYFLYIYIPRYRNTLKSTSNEVIRIFLDDHEIDWISHRSIRLTGSKAPCSPEKSDNILCQKKAEKYKYIMDSIPEHISYYFCSGWFIVQNSSPSLHYVWSGSPWNLLLSWLRFNTWYNRWLSYKVNPDKFNDAGGCYPWNELESYWKIYWKASPEEIQAVINEANK
jgi:hypothetical protein